MRARAITALVACCLPVALAAQPLGSLFHTPAERTQLERQRAGLGTDDGSELREPVITGYVKRSDGKSTVFLDRQPHRLDSRSEQRLLEPRLLAPARPGASSTAPSSRP